MTVEQEIGQAIHTALHDPMMYRQPGEDIFALYTRVALTALAPFAAQLEQARAELTALDADNRGLAMRLGEAASMVEQLRAELAQRTGEAVDAVRVVEDLRKAVQRAEADAEQARLLLAMHDLGVDPDGWYPGTPGWRLTRLLALRDAAQAWRTAHRRVEEMRGFVDRAELRALVDEDVTLFAAVDALSTPDSAEPDSLALPNRAAPEKPGPAETGSEAGSTKWASNHM